MVKYAKDQPEGFKNAIERIAIIGVSALPTGHWHIRDLAVINPQSRQVVLLDHASLLLSWRPGNLPLRR